MDRETHPRRRRALSLSEILKTALPSAAKRRIYSIELLQKGWAQAVGHELARRSEPESLGHGVLTVRVTDAAWGRTIAKLQHRIVPALNRVVGERLVERLQFVRRERLLQPPPLRQSAPGSKKRSAAPPPAEVAAALDGVADVELRAMLQRSASRYFEAQRERAARRR